MFVIKSQCYKAVLFVHFGFISHTKHPRLGFISETSYAFATGHKHFVRVGGIIVRLAHKIDSAIGLPVCKDWICARHYFTSIP
jgi:hypothetical protein